MRTVLFLFAVFLSAAESFCQDLPLRIVSLSPAVTEIICQLGAKDLLVGRSRVCDYPECVKNLPSAGDLGTPETERISKLNADVVISDVDNPAANWEQLRKLGIKVVLLRSDSISRYRENVSTIGRIVGREKAAEDEWKRFSAKLREIEESVRNIRKVPVAVFLGANPLVSCNDDTFIGELLKLSGASNVSGNIRKSYFIIAPEFILEKDPAAAVVADMSGSTKKQLLETSLLRNVKFIRNKAVIDTVPDEYFCRLSPRTLLAAEILKRELDKYRAP